MDQNLCPSQNRPNYVSLFLAFLLGFFGATTDLVAEPSGLFSRTLSGGVFKYAVQPGDYLIKIGARFGMPALILAQDNGLDYDGILRPGRELVVSNPHIVPEVQEDGVVINLPQRMLFLFRNGELLDRYPVGLGKPDWPTPAGQFKVANLQMDKDWVVPKSIQEEMLREGKVVKTRVPPGPDNPLGRYWIGLSLEGYGIHGTIAPASVYHFQSHGCIRLHPDDIEALFPLIGVGMKGKIIYIPTLLAEMPDGRVLLEVHRDIYEKGKGINPLETARQLAEVNGLTERIDWRRAEEVARRQEGLARDVTRADATKKEESR